MSFTRWLSERLGLSGIREQTRRCASPRKRPTFRPTLEALEDRWVPSTLTVTNNFDSGAGSLRADIAAAHNGDTINFAPSLDGQTIKLTSGELLIKQNVTIAGPADRSVTVSGGGLSRVFDVAKSTKSVTLSGLTISNGLAVGSDGGGIVNYGTLTVSNTTVSNNTAASLGGGIENEGVLTISSSSFTSNNAYAGAGIYNRHMGTLTISNSTLSDNVSTSNGGGINSDGTLTVSGCTLWGNSATGSAGGGMEIDGTSTISGTSVYSNSAAYGGGIYAANNYYNPGTTNISSSTVYSNSAFEGGGIYDAAGTTTISGTSVYSNSAQYGGGIYNYNDALTVSGSTLSGNTANNAGGGLWISGAGSGTVTVKNSSSITGNTAPVGFGADVYDLGVLYWDGSGSLGTHDGNLAKPI